MELDKCHVVLIKLLSWCVVSCLVVCSLFQTLRLLYASSKKCLRPLLVLLPGENKILTS